MRVLVIDDEDSVQRAMGWELKGHDVTAARSPGEALLALCHGEYDAILCDWHLGGDQTGARVLQIAAKLNTKARRFIVSGDVPEGLAPLLISGLAHRYIAKPWTPHDVRNALVEDQKSVAKENAEVRFE